jgi:hypothetical protein
MTGSQRLMWSISIIYFSVNCIVILIFNRYSFRRERTQAYDRALYMLGRVYPPAFEPAARFSGKVLERYYFDVTHPVVLAEACNKPINSLDP